MALADDGKLYATLLPARSEHRSISRGIRRDPGKGERAHGNLVERSTLTVLGNDDPTLLIRVLGPIAAQTVPVESVSILRGEDGPFVHIVLVLCTQPSVAETIARKIGRLVDVARVEVAAEEGAFGDRKPLPF